MLKSVKLPHNDVTLSPEKSFYGLNQTEIDWIMQSIANHPEPIIDSQSRQEILEGFVKRIRRTSLLSYSTCLRSIQSI